MLLNNKNDMQSGFETTEFANVLKEAMSFAKSHHVSYVATEFLLFGLTRVDSKVKDLLLAFGINDRFVFNQLINNLDFKNMNHGFTPRSKKIINDAKNIAVGDGCGFLAPEHLFVSLLSISCVANDIIKMRVKDFHAILDDANSLRSSLATMSKLSGSSLEDSKIKDSPIYQFGKDLTYLATHGKIQPVIGRDEEIKRVIQTLAKKTKSNPVLVGEPGVGKSAILEGLALKIAIGDVPTMLKDKILFSLDYASVVAGAKYKGEFEERLKSIIDYLESNDNILLFIDEIHNIVGHTADGVGASEMLKPALARGTIKLIGATTIEEYRKYIEKDPALERRFQMINVEEPKVEDCIKIIKGVKSSFESHHGIAIKDEAIVKAVELSDRYITDRFLPDKAFDLIDEACSNAKMTFDLPPDSILKKQNELRGLIADKRYLLSCGKDTTQLDKKIDNIRAEIDGIIRANDIRKNGMRPFIDGNDVAKIISGMMDIPVTKLTQTEADRLLHLEDILHKRVVGQNDAVKSISDAIRRGTTCVGDKKKPIGSFLFVGPTGVGKTELAKALAEALFDDEDSLIRIDMSEYMESASVSKLIGSPPGYIGYDEEGQLTEKVRRKPYSVVLFDEIEKAHADIFNILLQVLDDGRLTDSKGRLVNFKNTIIIMTSNEGAHQIDRFGDMNIVDKKNEIISALKQKFRLEFLNRMDEIIIFKRLSTQDCGKILDLLILSLIKQMKHNFIDLSFDNSSKELLLKKGYDSENGARPLKRVLQDYVSTPIANMILSGDIKPSSKVMVTVDSGDIDFNIR